MNGIGSHTAPVNGQTNDWITPRFITQSLCDFDLDPCCSLNQPWMHAAKGMNIHDDGLSSKWEGRVWLNPPYGRSTGKWLSKLADHGNGIALVFARTETKMFVDNVWKRADAVSFIHGRLHFCYPSGERAADNSGGPSVLVAYGQECADILSRQTGIQATCCNLTGTCLPK